MERGPVSQSEQQETRIFPAGSRHQELAEAVMQGGPLVRERLVEMFHEVAKQKESRVVEGHVMADHVHMCISIPPKYVVSNVVGFIKGKSAILIARNVMGRRRNSTGESFCARGYFVSTVGLDEQLVREYIRRQEQEDQRLDQLNMP